jgi:hypothetical protein
LEINNFIRLPNYTYTKKSDKDLDDRVFALIWALFILDPSLVGKYFIVQDLDDQGRPMKIFPLSDNKDILKNSPLLLGEKSVLTKKPSINTPYSHVGGSDISTGFDLYSEDRELLLRWMADLDAKQENINKKDSEDKDKSSMETFYTPVVLF